MGVCRVAAVLALSIWMFSMGAGLAGGAIAQEDRHAGYYYPENVTTEQYPPRVSAFPDANRTLRVGFITGLAQQMLESPFPPDYIILAKGEQAEKMIIVATGSGRYDTLFRMRALLALLSASARLSPLFQETSVPEDLTFFDLAAMLGFKQITVSDGKDFAHRIDLTS